MRSFAALRMTWVEFWRLFRQQRKQGGFFGGGVGDFF
jgi:hypothetical protein